MEKDIAGYSKLGPREKGRKSKGKRKPQALRDAKRKRSTFLQSLTCKK